MDGHTEPRLDQPRKDTQDRDEPGSQDPSSEGLHGDWFQQESEPSPPRSPSRPLSRFGLVGDGLKRVKNAGKNVGKHVGNGIKHAGSWPKTPRMGSTGLPDLDIPGTGPGTPRTGTPRIGTPKVPE